MIRLKTGVPLSWNLRLSKVEKLRNGAGSWYCVSPAPNSAPYSGTVLHVCGITLRTLDLGSGNPGTRTKSATNFLTSTTELLSVLTIFFLWRKGLDFAVLKNEHLSKKTPRPRILPVHTSQQQVFFMAARFKGEKRLHSKLSFVSSGLCPV